MSLPAARSPARGFGLAETLVALTLLSLGLVSTVAILVQCLRHEREAATRSAALRLAATLGEELRAMRPPDGRALLSVTGVSPAIACAQRPDSCAAESAAAAVMETWRTGLLLEAPAGALGSVEVPDPAVPVYRIGIAWPSAGAGEESTLLLVVET